MRVRHFNGPDRLYSIGDEVAPILTEGNVIVVADQSKSNSAIIIANTTGSIYDIIEVSGNDRNYYAVPQDTTVYCREVEVYLRERLKGCNVIKIHIEEPITKHKKGAKGALQNFKTTMILTEIRGSYNRIALDMTNEASDEVNNWSWKNGVLPPEYRAHGEKGSYLYWITKDIKWLNYTDDVTDVYSMYIYLLKSKYQNEKILCDKREKASREYTFAYVPLTTAANGNLIEFSYSKYFPLEANCNYYVNRKSTTGYARIPAELISIENLYKYGKGLNKDCPICLVVSPKK